MADTAIEWTDRVWNPTTGCDRVSPGCDNCYAMTMAKRLKGMGSAKYQRDGDPRTSGPGFGVSVHPATLAEPLKWRKPQRIFVNSMSDLFHDQIPDDYIARVFGVMAVAERHTFQVLTKRPGRMRSLLSDSGFQSEVAHDVLALTVADDNELPLQITDVIDWWPIRNVWLGVSAENQKWADVRIPVLLGTPAAVRFISAEPLLGPIDLTDCASHNVLDTTPRMSSAGRQRPRLDWVIAGGESGPDHRPLELDWVRQIRDDCDNYGVAFLFKQVGGRTPKAGGRELDGRTWDQYPDTRQEAH